jgi:hypothetical protein
MHGQHILQLVFLHCEETISYRFTDETQNLHPYPVHYPVPISPPPPPPPPKLESHSISAVQPNLTSSAPQKPHVIPISNSAKPELPATLPAQITFVACHHCSICGKPRSAGYHRDHPLIPGQVAESEPCRKCVRASRDQPVAHIVMVNETSSERRKAQSPSGERTGTRMVIHESCRSRNRSRSLSRHPSLSQTSPQPHREEDIEYRHVSERPGVEVRTESTGRFGKDYSVHSAPARKENWKYRHELRTTFVQPLPRPFNKERDLAHQRGETWDHRKKTGEAVSRSQSPYEELPPAPIPEDRATYRRRRSLSTYPESTRERYMNTPLEVKEVSRTIKIYRGGPVGHQALLQDEDSLVLTSALIKSFAGSSTTRRTRRQ